MTGVLDVRSCRLNVAHCQEGALPGELDEAPGRDAVAAWVVDLHDIGICSNREYWCKCMWNRPSQAEASGGWATLAVQLLCGSPCGRVLVLLHHPGTMPCTPMAMTSAGESPLDISDTAANARCVDANRRSVRVSLTPMLVLLRCGAGRRVAHTQRTIVRAPRHLKGGWLIW